MKAPASVPIQNFAPALMNRRTLSFAVSITFIRSGPPSVM